MLRLLCRMFSSVVLMVDGDEVMVKEVIFGVLGKVSFVFSGYCYIVFGCLIE